MKGQLKYIPNINTGLVKTTMPKQIDYPRASLKNSITVADAVNDLGGQCSAALAADKLGKQPTSGAYKALVGACVKYGLLSNKKGQLEISQLYRDIILAYDELEANRSRQKAFLSPPLFQAVFNRFENKPLPVSHFEKLLIREFDVQDQYASRVSGYFLEGAKQCGLLGDNDILSKIEEAAAEVIENGDNDIETTESEEKEPGSIITEPSKHHIAAHPAEENGKFSVRIKGPGMDSLIVVNEEEDLIIVRAMLKKVEKRLEAENEWGE